MQHPQQYTAPQPGTGPVPGPRELFIHPDFPGRVLCGHRTEVIPDDVYAPTYEMFEGNQRMKIHRDGGVEGEISRERVQITESANQTKI
jgi:hypothetical protein